MIDDTLNGGYLWSFFADGTPLCVGNYLGVEFPESIEIKTMYFQLYFYNSIPTNLKVYIGDNDDYELNDECG